MKAAIFSTLLPLVLALPAPQTQSTEGKLPWKKGSVCLALTEDCMGTIGWCNAEAQRLKEFGAREKCLAQRERRPADAPKLPWMKGTGYDCAYALTPEERCYGTALFCREGLYPQGQYRDEQECLSDREDAPKDAKKQQSLPEAELKAKKPFLQPAPDSDTSCMTFDRGSERCVGTKYYCTNDIMKFPYTDEDGSVYNNAAECLDARESEPQSADPDRIVFPDN
ncbi:hypothetical protein BDV32DRAFT_125326 [Aspergillus pseudonomiae]|uniref:Uncharacterized protein n=1 Tax=Aspergillus pseudonomiae TaxID=1506151 RepID=A0A5N6HW55_9EURO|nr:uncharacterized protein BDV37DRAFT_91551 [Aspergillus pseudonomiae]KAB8258655.1 hypothetical protein BDV32DRAFT_125326 [Aspergillus pseudonomiae]KAE8405417.1 hypothetical protein BDV37DRAFT_91551 [Aspergillus pseudonomiae]